ncbi:MAG: DUF5009 domain-containing protein [Bacteroidetes bacterium]|nr:DUF5009 domain-containing protein [Bacteroidota bacterium]
MEIETKTRRLASLDALRGFDMFWIMGGDGLSVALAAATGWPVLKWWATQVEHAEWHGFHFYDMVFPLFLFIAGIAFPFSLSQRKATSNKVVLHLVRRGLMLVLLGFIYNNAIRFNFGELRFPSVLGRIGLAWMFAGLLWVYLPVKWRIPALTSILLAYWGLLEAFHVPGLDSYSMEGSLVGLVDRTLVPGKLYLGIHDPEGLAGLIPATATALLGMLTGEAVRQTQRSDYQTLSLKLFAIGSFLFAGGWLWHLAMPVNKNLWTSSFVLVAGGLSMALFALFFWIIDVKNLNSWAFPFRVIGMNAIAIYMGQRIFQLGHTSDFLFGGVVSRVGETWQPVMQSVGYILTCWLLLYFLYRKRIFFKV